MKITYSQPSGIAGVMAGNAPAGGVTVIDTGGYYTGTNLEAILAEIGAGLSPGAFLTVIGGGKGTVQALGNLGATELIDLANGNKFWGTLDQDCTITTVGWTNLKDAQISVELIQNGTGGWTPTFSGVTWIGGTPIWTTTAGTVTHVVLFSRDGGTTIYGAVVGGGGMDNSLVTVAASGTTETINVAAARTYDVTLTANCTLTLTGAVTAQAWFVTLILRQDGTGSRTVTWPGSVVWPGGITPTLATAAASVDVFTLFTLDGGTVWFGFPTGGGGVTVQDEGTPLATAGMTLNFVGTGVAATGAGTTKTITINGVTATEVAGLVAAGGHAHVNNVLYSGDAVTTAFTLPVAPMDSESVAAYVAGVRLPVTLSGTYLDTMTFGSAPASGTDNIIVDIAAVLV